MPLKLGNITRITLGVQGEACSRPIEIDVSEWLDLYPNGVITVWNCPHGTNIRYPVDVTVDRDTKVLSWLPSADDTYNDGAGLCIFRIDENGVTRSTCRIPTKVFEGLPGTTEEDPPDYGEPWMTRMEGYAETAVNAADDVFHMRDRTLTHTPLTTGKYVIYSSGELASNSQFDSTAYVDVRGCKKIRYSRVKKETIQKSGMAFYGFVQGVYFYISGVKNTVGEEPGYEDAEIEVPEDAVYARFTVWKSSYGYGSFYVQAVNPVRDIADSKYRKIVDLTLEEEAIINITKDSDGNDFSLDHIAINLTVPKTNPAINSLHLQVSSSVSLPYGIVSNTGYKMYTSLRYDILNDTAYSFEYASHTNNVANKGNVARSLIRETTSNNNKCTMLKTVVALPAGTNIVVWGY